jgi:hypothetical protein
MPSNQWGPWQPASNLGETATETYLSTFGESEPQQGSTAINAAVSCNGGVSAAAQQTFRWQ